jgi:3-oxoacyl-[acyl-carrier protein] reductase
MELAPFGITVNNILPGFTRTQRLETLVSTWAQQRKITVEEMENQLFNVVPMGRFASPEEIGSVAAFLATPAASYVTGVSLPVDGGRTKCL